MERCISAYRTRLSKETKDSTANFYFEGNDKISGVHRLQFFGRSPILREPGTPTVFWPFLIHFIFLSET